jgi:oligopeptide transport system ATP-binding protein
MNRLLDVEDLHLSFDTHAGQVHALRGVSFHVNAGEVLGIVGESGCGKSVTAQSILGLLPSPPTRVNSGCIRFDGEDLLDKSASEMQRIRGKEISMIFQDPMTSLNPTMRIGKQIMEALTTHLPLTASQAYKRAIDLLEMVGIPDSTKRVNEYPHQFSGGMRQRVMIAMALACKPRLLIADEPTTALDVTIQAQILTLMRDLQQKTQTGIILITHDLGVVAGICDRIVVMYAGRVVEEGSVTTLFSAPQHPYTQALLRAVPRLGLESKNELESIAGSPPDLRTLPQGCSFAPRCPHAMEICLQKQPTLHPAACWLHHPMAPKTRVENR